MEIEVRPLATGARVRVRRTPDMTVVGKLHGTVVRPEPGRPAHYQVRLDGPIGQVNGRRVRLPGRTITAHAAYLDLLTAG